MFDLREYRKFRKLTQEELAEASGVARSHISCLENRYRAPSVETAKKLADALGVSWTVFFE